MRRLPMMMRRPQSGFGLITAIFLMVLLTALSAMMATFFVAQQQSQALDVLGSRAYQAARTGIEWAAGNAPAWSGCPVIHAPLFSANTLEGTLSAYTVTVACNSATSAVASASAVAWVYSITASASGVGNTTPGDADYVERVIQANIWSQGASSVVIWR
jgi:MSHA biogenesis protein MshP